MYRKVQMIRRIVEGTNIIWFYLLFFVLGWEWMNWDRFVPANKCFRPLEIVIEKGYNPFHIPSNT